jgi:CRISPR/Cas system CSM-associated protein Csm2 small subunit
VNIPIDASMNEQRRCKALGRQLKREVARNIKTHAALERMLHQIPDPDHRRQFFETIKEFLPFQTEWGPVPVQEAHVSENQ